MALSIRLLSTKDTVQDVKDCRSFFHESFMKYKMRTFFTGRTHNECNDTTIKVATSYTSGVAISHVHQFEARVEER